jgi:predicted anti-sigma-YlaC factor YlaD
MNSAQHISQDDLYLFALQLLPEDQMRASYVHLQECAVCRAELGQIQADLVTYALTAEMTTPPTQARERLLHQVAKEKKLIPIDRNEQAIEPMLYPRNSRMFQVEAPEEPKRRFGLVTWTGWAIAAAAAVVAVLQFQQGQVMQHQLSIESAKLTAATTESAKANQLMQTLTDQGAMQVSLHIPLTPGEQPKLDPEAHAVYVPGKGSLVFVANHLDPLQPYKTYELWLLPSDKTAKPIPAGLFKPDQFGNASLVLPELPKGVAAGGFGVTIEEDGGSQTPTAPIILAGVQTGA